MVSALALDSTITRGLGTGSYGLGVGSAVQCGRRGTSGTVSARDSGAAERLCQLRAFREASGWAVYPAPPWPSCTCSRPSWRSVWIRRRSSTIAEPVRRDRADAHHLRRDRPADRLLPPRRLAPLHRRVLANQGKLNLAVVLVGCFVAAVIGDQVGFTFGQKAGPPLFRRPDLHGSSNRSTSTGPSDFFDEHGAKTIVLARFVPVVRTFAPVLAGIGKMSRRTFLSFNVIGALRLGVRRDAGRLLRSADAIGDIDRQVPAARSSRLIIIISLIPPFLEWRKAKKQKPVHFTQAQAEAEAAALHEVVEDD